MSNDDERVDALRQFLETSSAILGGLAGGAVGRLIGTGGDYLGAVGAPAMSHALNRTAVDFLHRHLSDREKARTAAVLVLTGERIKAKLAQGYELRADDFFVAQFVGRIIADEIAEGVLLAAQREHEERKLRFLADLLTNIAFRPDIDRAQANLLIRRSEGLSYRQLSLIAVLANRERLGLPEPDAVIERGDISQDTSALLHESHRLATGDLLVSEHAWMFGGGTMHPARFTLSRIGTLLYELMELREIGDDELSELVRLL